MSFINYASREINCKIVYYGPGLCGKTTNLQYIYNKTANDAKGKMISLATETERTLFFDFLPLALGEIRGFKFRDFNTNGTWTSCNFNLLVDYFGDGDPCLISSMCSVFAESEVINLINEGVELPHIVKGLLQSLVIRVSSLTQRLGVVEDLVMTGGVAKNKGVQDAIEKKLKTKMQGFNGTDPQIVGALGAALIAADFAEGKTVTS